jgi:hypothetical protein
MTQPLSPELQIACEIYHQNINKRPVWFTKLVEYFAGTFTREEVSHHLDTLTDWMIIEGGYGETVKGRAGYCFSIDLDHGGHMIPELYEKYWKDTR